MRASRAVFASTDAAATLRLIESAKKNTSWRAGRLGSVTASMTSPLGATPRPSMARRIASRVAGTIPIASISPASAQPTAKVTATIRIKSAKCSRADAESFLESVSPRSCRSVALASGRITAPAATGPAHAPRPASSMPATGEHPAASRARSWRRVGRASGRGGAGRGGPARRIGTTRAGRRRANPPAGSGRVPSRRGASHAPDLPAASADSPTRPAPRGLCSPAVWRQTRPRRRNLP